MGDEALDAAIATVAAEQTEWHPRGAGGGERADGVTATAAPSAGPTHRPRWRRTGEARQDAAGGPRVPAAGRWGGGARGRGGAPQGVVRWGAASPTGPVVGDANPTQGDNDSDSDACPPHTVPARGPPPQQTNTEGGGPGHHERHAPPTNHTTDRPTRGSPPTRQTVDSVGNFLEGFG